MASVVTLKDRREIPLLYLRLLQRIEALEGRINGLWRTDLTWARMTADAPVRELFAVTTSDCPSQADMVGVAPAPSPPITMRADGAAVQMILDACPHSSSHATFEGSSYTLSDYVIKLGTCKRASQSKAVVMAIHHPDLEAAEGGARALTERLLSLLEIPCDACTQHVAESRDEAQQYIAAFRECALVGA